jgi:hypothetical protein
MGIEAPETRVAVAWLRRHAGAKLHVALRDLPPVLQRALKSVRYNRRDIGVEEGSSFTPSEGSSGFEGNRGYVVVVDLAGGHFKTHEGAWGGPSPFDRRQVDLDRKPQAIPPNGAVIIGEYGGRGSFASIRVHPSNLQAVLPRPAEEIQKDEAAALKIIRSYKSGYRGQAFQEAALGRYGPDNPLIRSLAAKGMVKIDTRGSIQITTDGRNAIASRTASEKVAGGSDFTVFVKGHDAQRAFKQAVDDARHERGHGGYSGSIAEKGSFKLRSSKPMSMSEAQHFVDQDIEDNDKWGPAFAVPISETKVKKEGELTLKVKARSRQTATEEAIKTLNAKTKPGVVVEITVQKITELKGGGAPKVEKAKGTQMYVAISRGPQDRLEGRYPNRAAAMDAIKGILISTQAPVSKGASFSVWKVQELEKIVVAEESSRQPVWEVVAKVREVEKGPVIGYLFYGIASS